MLSKQRRTFGRTSPDDSVAFDMLNTVVDRMGDAEAECEAAFEAIDDKIREVEVHCTVVGGRLGDFEASLD